MERNQNRSLLANDNKNSNCLASIKAKKQKQAGKEGRKFEMHMKDRMGLADEILKLYFKLDKKENMNIQREKQNT